MKKPSCAVTGSNGYVGSYIVNRLLAEEKFIVYEVGRKRKNFSVYDFIFHDLKGGNDFSKFKEIDILIHCAYDFSLTSFKDINNINIKGTLELFSHAAQMGVKRILFISSMSSFDEAKSNYGKAKFLIEKNIKGLPVTIIRPGLIFSKNSSGLFGAISKFIATSQIVPLIGSGNQVFYPCHLSDLYQLILFLCQSNESCIDPIIAAANQPTTFKEIVKIVAATNQKRIFLLPTPYHLLYLGLKFLEKLHLSIGLRSDSLTGAYFYNKKIPDLNFVKMNRLNFRPLNKNTIQEII
jgi:nucleoside-diphosphate-sugar epimerase